MHTLPITLQLWVVCSPGRWFYVRFKRIFVHSVPTAIIGCIGCTQRQPSLYLRLHNTSPVVAALVVLLQHRVIK